MSIRLLDKDSPSTDKERELNGKMAYASAIGSIMYAMVATRHDLAYVVGVVRQYMSNLERKHWEADEHICRDLRGTKDARLTFGSANSTEVEGYTDSDYARNMDNRKLTSAYLFTYGGGSMSSTYRIR